MEWVRLCIEQCMIQLIGFEMSACGDVSKHDQSAVILGVGQAFGEIVILTDDLTRTASIVTIDWSYGDTCGYLCAPVPMSVLVSV